MIYNIDIVPFLLKPVSSALGSGKRLKPEIEFWGKASNMKWIGFLGVGGRIAARMKASDTAAECFANSRGNLDRKSHGQRMGSLWTPRRSISAPQT